MFKSKLKEQATPFFPGFLLEKYMKLVQTFQLCYLIVTLNYFGKFSLNVKQ